MTQANGWNASGTFIGGVMPTGFSGNVMDWRALDGTVIFQVAATGAANTSIPVTANSLTVTNAASFGNTITCAAISSSNQIKSTYAGAASTSVFYLTGQPYSAGTATTNFPQYYSNAGTTAVTTFSLSGTYFGINTASFSGNYFDFHYNGAALPTFLMDCQGDTAIYQTGSISGRPILLNLVGGAHTTLAASTEAPTVSFDCSAVKQWAAGTITNQREVFIKPPTLAQASAGTFTNAATFAIQGPPISGTNATITNLYSFWNQGGTARFDGPLNLSGVYLTPNANGNGGLLIGSAANQKIGFYNIAPIVQPSGDIGSGLINIGIMSGPTYSMSATNLSLGTVPSGNGVDSFSLFFGVLQSGTFTPYPHSGNFQHGQNNGAHTLAVPPSPCTMILEYTNGGSAGAITTSSYTKQTGDALTTTSGSKFLMYITKTQNYSNLNVLALQ